MLKMLYEDVNEDTVRARLSLCITRSEILREVSQGVTQSQIVAQNSVVHRNIDLVFLISTITDILSFRALYELPEIRLSVP